MCLPGSAGERPSGCSSTLPRFCNLKFLLRQRTNSSLPSVVHLPHPSTGFFASVSAQTAHCQHSDACQHIRGPSCLRFCSWTTQKNRNEASRQCSFSARRRRRVVGPHGSSPTPWPSRSSLAAENPNGEDGEEGLCLALANNLLCPVCVMNVSNLSPAPLPPLSVLSLSLSLPPPPSAMAAVVDNVIGQAGVMLEDVSPTQPNLTLTPNPPKI